MSADPQDLAAMLEQLQAPNSDGPPSPPQAAPFVGGVLKGMVWNPIKQAYEAAKGYGQGVADAITHPDPTGSFEKLLQGYQDKAGAAADQITTHPLDAVGNAASSTMSGLTSGDPDTVGQTLGGFIGPGDVAKGLEALNGAGKVNDIWGGSKALTHDPERAVDAQASKALGGSDQEIWDQTGMYNTPSQWGQSQPWHWIDDSKASILPGAVDKVKSGTATLGDVVHPDWDAFKAYPGLADMPVSYTGAAAHNVSGAYLPNTGEMKLGPAALNDPDELLKTVVHETSHAVQHYEGMPQGSSQQLAQAQRRMMPLALTSDAVALPDKATVRELMGNFENATRGKSVFPERNAYANTVGEVGAQTAEAMLSAPRGFRPFELARALSSVPPEQQLVVGNRGGLFHPSFADADADLEDHLLTGRFAPPGPDLSRGGPRK